MRIETEELAKLTYLLQVHLKRWDDDIEKSLNLRDSFPYLYRAVMDLWEGHIQHYCRSVNPNYPGCGEFLVIDLTPLGVRLLKELLFKADYINLDTINEKGLGKYLEKKKNELLIRLGKNMQPEKDWEAPLR